MSKQAFSCKTEEGFLWICQRCGTQYLEDYYNIIPDDGICDSCKKAIEQEELEKKDKNFGPDSHAETQKEEGIKHDKDKLRFDLFPPEALEEVAKVYTFGAKKYGDRNWEKGLKWGRIFGAIQRHLWSFWKGEDKDPETGILHVAHAAWGCLALIYFYLHRPDLDDRPINFKAELISKLEKLKEDFQKNLKDRLDGKEAEADR